MAGEKVKVKGTIKSVPNSKGKKPVKPQFRNMSRGLLTDKIIVTVKKDKKDDKSNNAKSK